MESKTLFLSIYHLMYKYNLAWGLANLGQPLLEDRHYLADLLVTDCQPHPLHLQGFLLSILFVWWIEQNVTI